MERFTLHYILVLPFSNLLKNGSVSSSHKVMESFGTLVIHLVSFTSKEKRNNLKRMDSSEIFLNTKGPQNIGDVHGDLQQKEL